MTREKDEKLLRVEAYEHADKKRVNNPPVGLVNISTDPGVSENIGYSHDPYIDPQLQWAGKNERAVVEVPKVSLYVHERVDPRTIIEAVRKGQKMSEKQLTLFDNKEQNRPIREAIEFYKHTHGWSNRLTAGDSLLVMNSLIEKEGMAGKIQAVYIDPPYGIKYGSNFQPFFNKRDVKDGKDEDLTSEPEQIKAFRDTWELGIHSYLTYMRDRLLLSRELLNESGSIFVQISDDNVHHMRELLDEVFGNKNFVVSIIFTKTGSKESGTLDPINDYLIWYAKDKKSIKLRKIFEKRTYADMLEASFKYQNDNGDMLAIPNSYDEKQIVRVDPITSDGFRETTTIQVEFDGKNYFPGNSNHWKTTYDGLRTLDIAGRLIKRSSLGYLRYFKDFSVKNISNLWNSFGGARDMKYIVQTNEGVVQRAILMTTDPGDLVFDPTCGSGTTAYVAEQWGRRWITCDTSRVAITLTRQRLMTAVFDYYELAHPSEGVGSGFKYKTVPHVTLKSIANNPDIQEGMTREQIDAAIARHAPQETLYDQPYIDKKKKRVSGPFTVEAVPAPAVHSIEEVLSTAQPADNSVARSGETLRQAEWRDELQRTGIRAKGGQHIHFLRLEPLPGCRWLHADGETRPIGKGADTVKENGTAYLSQRLVVSFGPEHAPLEQRQVEMAIEEAQNLVPKPKLIAFAAFQFDPEAAKDIDETNWPGVTLLKVQMNADLLTDDLKKNRASNESFWLIGQPDVQVEQITKGDDQGKYRVAVNGFDYYNTKTGDIESGGSDKIAIWLLDTDYDGRSLYPRQVFFPQAGAKEGWARLAKNLKTEIDEELIEAYRGTTSLPFEAGSNRRIAVKIVDDRGIESLKLMEIK